MRKLLLDTHVFLWCLSNPHMLNEEARNAIINGKNPVFVSAATTWEISIKKALGKLHAPDNLDHIVEEKRFSGLPVLLYHGQLAGELPNIHRDPFDRMLIAQAQAEGLILVTADAIIMEYSVRTMDTR